MATCFKRYPMQNPREAEFKNQLLNASSRPLQVLIPLQVVILTAFLPASPVAEVPSWCHPAAAEGRCRSNSDCRESGISFSQTIASPSKGTVQMGNQQVQLPCCRGCPLHSAIGLVSPWPFLPWLLSKQFSSSFLGSGISTLWNTLPWVTISLGKSSCSRSLALTIPGLTCLAFPRPNCCCTSSFLLSACLPFSLLKQA